MSVFEAVKSQAGQSHAGQAQMPGTAWPQPYQGGQSPFGPGQAFGAGPQPTPFQQYQQQYQQHQQYQPQQPYAQQGLGEQQGMAPLVADAAARVAPLVVNVVIEALRAEPQSVASIQATGQLPPHLYPLALMEAANRIAPVLQAVLARQIPQYGQQQPYPQQPQQHPLGQQQPYLQQHPFGPQQLPYLQQQPFGPQQHPLGQQQPYLQPQPFGPQQQPYAQHPFAQQPFAQQAFAQHVPAFPTR